MKRFTSCFLIALMLIGIINNGNMPEAKNSRKNTLLSQNNYSDSYIVTENTGNDFPLVANGKAALIYVDENDSVSVKRAVNDFKDDIKRVTDVEANIVNKLPNGGNVVLIGTIGNSEAIDTLISGKKLNVDDLIDTEGKYKWEGFIIDVIENPFPGISQALVVAGCDRRGTIYGVYDISEKMGVSPWYFFADVAIRKKDNVFVKSETRIADAPDVQYRGIFINDEEKLNGWAKRNSNDGTIGPTVYKHIFELLLRMKANYIWPAMHVNAFNNDPENGRLAEEYGIVVGSTHCDMLLRNNNNEWDRWKKAKGYSSAQYDYTVNPEIIREYWKESVLQNKDYEVQWTLGMRGAHDEPFTTKNINDGSYPGETEQERKVNLLGQIIKDQQEILKEVLGEEKYEESFQMFIPYKEVLPLYDAGLEVPENVTIMWVDDNNGFVRRLPNEAERQRKGGHGLYYHVSYWAPYDQSYMWLNSIPLALIGEQLQRSYESGIRKVWIVNVGDIKPAEGEVEFFIKYGWDVKKYENNTKLFLKEWISRQFGNQYADEAADIITDFYQLTNMRKLEHMRIDIFDQLHYADEATDRMMRYQDLFDRANNIYDQLPDEMKDGFYELVLCKIRWAYYVNKSFYYADRSNMAYDQERLSSANNFLKLSQEAEQAKKDEIQYYNKELAKGKWDGLMNPEEAPPPVIPQLPAGSPALVLGKPEMGVIVQGEERISDNSILMFSELGRNGKYIDIFNKGAESFEWTADVDKDWIVLSKTGGKVIDEDRIWVNIKDIEKHKGEKGTISLKSGNTVKTIKVEIVNTSVSLKDIKGYAEADGFVSIEAEHYSRKNDKGDIQWQIIYDLGRAKGHVMRAYNPSLTSVSIDNSPTLEYDIHFESTGKFPLEIYRIPTLNARGTLRFAVSVDDKEPIVVSSKAVDEGQGTIWVDNIFSQIEKHVVNINIDTAGKHTLKLWMLDNYIMIDKMVIYTDSKGILYSYNGPEESYHSEYNNTFYSYKEMLPREIPSEQEQKNEMASWGKGVFIEENGKIAIEAEVAIENSEYARVIAKSGNTWRLTQSDTGYAMRLPDQGKYWTNAADLVPKSPEMQYKIHVSKAGNYSVWARVRSIDNASDSLLGGINNEYKPSSFDTSGWWTNSNDEKWTWVKVGSINIPSGEHILNIWMREDGISVDRFYLTTALEAPPRLNWVVSRRSISEIRSIESVELLEDISVKFGTAEEDIGLPQEVEATLSDGTTLKVKIKDWRSSPKYHGDEPGEYTFTGILDLTDGIINPNDITAKVKVIVEKEKTVSKTIESVEKLNDIKVGIGTALEDIGLPQEVEVTLNDGTTLKVKVKHWASSPEYEGYKSGEYTFTGILDEIDGVLNAKGLTALVKVVVEKEKVTPKPTESPESPETPKTGDNINLIILALASVLSLFGIVMALKARRKTGNLSD